MKKTTKAMIFGGLLLILAALALTGYNLIEDMRSASSEKAALAALEEVIATAEPSASATEESETTAASEQPESTEESQEEQEETPAETEASSLEGESDTDASLLNTEMATVLVDGEEYIGILEIPSLELSLPVISEWSYARLKLAPCRYAGSAYDGSLVIAGHNYASQFRELKNLQAGDTVIFTDVNGNVFTYTVIQLEQLQPTEIEEMVTGDWDLTLFTCTVGGKARVAVRCDEVQ